MHSWLVWIVSRLCLLLIRILRVVVCYLIYSFPPKKVPSSTITIFSVTNWPVNSGSYAALQRLHVRWDHILRHDTIEVDVVTFKHCCFDCYVELIFKYLKASCSIFSDCFGVLNDTWKARRLKKMVLIFNLLFSVEISFKFIFCYSPHAGGFLISLTRLLPSIVCVSLPVRKFFWKQHLVLLFRLNIWSKFSFYMTIFCHFHEMAKHTPPRPPPLFFRT